MLFVVRVKYAPFSTIMYSILIYHTISILRGQQHPRAVRAGPIFRQPQAREPGGHLEQVPGVRVQHRGPGQHREGGEAQAGCAGEGRSSLLDD